MKPFIVDNYIIRIYRRDEEDLPRYLVDKDVLIRYILTTVAFFEHRYSRW